MLGTHVSGKVVALPSAPFQALLDGPGLNTIGSAAC
jgi:hypothetical protein